MEDVTLKFAVFLSFVAISFASEQGMPLFMWSNNRLYVPSPISGHTTTGEEFNKNYIGRLLSNKQNIVAFIQDKLSVDDITQHADVYNENSDGAALRNLKNLLEQHSSAQLPSVKNVPDILDKLRKEFQGKVHELKEPYDIGDLPLDDSSNLIIAKLPSTGDSHAQLSAQLKNNDDILKSVNDDLKSMGQPFTAIFTAEKPSKKSEMRTGRRLLQNDDAALTYSFFNVSGFLYFYAESIEVILLKTDKQSGRTLFTLPFSEKYEDSSAGNTTGTLKLKYTDVPANDTVDSKMNIEMTFAFEVGSGPVWSGFWRIAEFNATYDGSNSSGKWEGQNITLKGYDIFAPFTSNYQFSYHCTNTDPYFQHLKKDATGVSQISVRFKGLQVQYSTKDMPVGTNFGRPNDCTGFFTIPILSGLFAGLILMLILFYGISMISSITTMDRFDDPKGKTITVNVTE